MVAASATRILVLSSGPVMLLLVACDIIHSLVIWHALLPGWDAPNYAGVSSRDRPT